MDECISFPADPWLLGSAGVLLLLAALPLARHKSARLFAVGASLAVLFGPMAGYATQERLVEPPASSHHSCKERAGEPS